MDAEMAQLVDDVRHETRVKSDSEVIRAAIRVAKANEDHWLEEIICNKPERPSKLAEEMQQVLGRSERKYGQPE